MVAGEGPLQAFTRAVSLLLLPCELPLDRKSAGFRNGASACRIIIPTNA
jgi:hypothetical protein